MYPRRLPALCKHCRSPEPSPQQHSLDCVPSGRSSSGSKQNTPRRWVGRYGGRVHIPIPTIAHSTAHNVTIPMACVCFVHAQTGKRHGALGHWGNRWGEQSNQTPPSRAANAQSPPATRIAGPRVSSAVVGGGPGREGAACSLLGLCCFEVPVAALAADDWAPFGQARATSVHWGP